MANGRGDGFFGIILALTLSLAVLGAVLLAGRSSGIVEAATGDLGTWRSTAALDVPRWAFAAAASNSYLYVSGGETTGGLELTGTMRAAINTDGSLGSWQQQALLSAPRIDHGMLFTQTASGNSCLYVLGGYAGQDTKVTNTVEYATIDSDGSIGTWLPAASMTANRAHFGVAVYGGKLYALGGLSSNTGTPTSTVEYAPISNDCSLGSWQPTVAMTATHAGNRAFAANGYLYNTGDVTGAMSNSVQYAPIGSNGSLGNWTTASSLNRGRGDHAVLASTQTGYVYALGGMTAAPYSRTVERAALNSNGTLGNWTLLTDMPASSEDMAFAQANGRIYILGGYSSGITTTVLYSLIDGAGPPDLSGSAQQVSSAAATPGQTITYTVVVSNSGFGPASARITDTLPASVSYQTGSVSNSGTYSTTARSITWAGSVAAGSAISITYRATITNPLDNGTLITNTATINDGYSAPFDTAPVTTTISSSPDLTSSAKKVKRPIASPGGTANYSIVVSNTGTMNISARVTDTLPLSLTYVANSLQSTMGTSLYDSGTGTIYWAGPSLVSVPVTISYQAKIPASAASGTVITNTANIQGTGSAARETAPVTVTVAADPSRIGWQNLGLYGIRAEDLEIDAAANVVYVASGGSTGIYRSLDGGQTWLPSSTFAGCLRFQINRSTGTVYANCRPGIDQGGIFQTTDQGATWTAILNRTLYPAFGDAPSRDIGLAGSTLYVADGSGGVWVSTNAGTTWTRHAVAQSIAIQSLAIDPITPAVVYVATSNKAFKSVNSGESWAELTTLPPGGSDFRSIAVNPHNPNLVFVGTGMDGGNKLYKSVDSGATWTTLSPGVGSFWWIEFHPTEPNTMYTQGNRSTDNGDTWQHFQDHGMGLAIDPTNTNIIYAATQLGVHKSTDGATTWTEIDTGLEEVSVRGVAENPRDVNNFMIGAGQGFGVTLDNGANWTWPVDMSGMPQADMFGEAVAIEPSTSYMGGPGILGRSTDHGVTWSPGNLQSVVQSTLGSQSGSGIKDIAVVPGETGHLFAAVAQSPEGNPTPKGGIYESTDAGLTWTNTGFPSVPANTVGFATTAGGTVIYAGAGDTWGKFTGAGNVYTSTVGNTSTWQQVSISTTMPVIGEVRVDPTDPLVVYAGGGVVDTSDSAGRLNGALFKSTDGGATWRSIMPSLNRPSGIRAIAIDPAFTNNVFLSIDSSIYQSVDGGATWNAFSTANLGMEGVYALIVPPPTPSPVVTFTASISGSQAALSWTNPGNSDFAGVVIRYSMQGFPKLSTDGITLTTVAGTPGTTGSYTHTDVISGTTYYYSVFAYNTAGRYSLPFQTAANSGAAALSNGAAELQLRFPASLPRRPAAQASARAVYAASSSGLFAKEIAGQTIIYLPALMKGFEGGW